MEKRGQASMEFLMTYGWAILAAVLAVGALAYYGVFNPSSSLPDTCVINGLVGCAESQVNATGVTLVLRNGAGENVNITSVDVSASGTGVTCTAVTPGVTVSDGSTTSQFLSCTGLSADDKFSGDIELQFLRSGRTLTETARGDIRATVA